MIGKDVVWKRKKQEVVGVVVVSRKVLGLQAINRSRQTGSSSSSLSITLYKYGDPRSPCILIIIIQADS